MKLIVLLAAASLASAADPWQPLFDGSSFTGWTLGDGAAVTHSWVIEDGTIATVAGTAGRSDLLCTRPMRDFELSFEFRLSKGSNTGVKYFVQQALRYLYPGSALTGAYGAIGLEFQLADDAAPDVALPEQKLGALYGLLATEAAPQHTIGDWATARLLCRKGVCEHWVNGKRVLAYDLASPEVQHKLRDAATNPAHSIVGATSAQVALRRKPGVVPPALIALQQHASKAWFRNLQVRDLH